MLRTMKHADCTSALLHYCQEYHERDGLCDIREISRLPCVGGPLFKIMSTRLLGIVRLSLLIALSTCADLRTIFRIDRGQT